MGKVYLLDCTLRDGGYVNDWRFGFETIKGFSKKISQTGIEIYEVGFLKGATYDPNRAIFPTIDSYKDVITPKNPNMKYVAMLDMSNPIPLELIPKYDGTSVDGIRVIFKKDKLKEAYEYCKKIQELGYFISVNFVGTDLYTDEEFIHGIQYFNSLNPYAMAIVDTFGLIKKKQFLRLIYIADNNMNDGIVLGYHAHNNLQQAFGNAEALVELNLRRNVIIDACVFGMGRGAGNLNLELFAEYMNENYDTNYRIEPMLEIMDEYLSDIYKRKQWGYSLPLYLSATSACHPNYAIYLAEKDSLNVASFNELLKSISKEDKINFSKEKAELYYSKYLEQEKEDCSSLQKLQEIFHDKQVVLLAPGRSLLEYQDKVLNLCKDQNNIVVSVNFNPVDIDTDFVFSSNMKRFRKIVCGPNTKTITTSNMQINCSSNFVVSFSKIANNHLEIIDNSGLMLLRLLKYLEVKNVLVAGMDGYSEYYGKDYYEQGLEYDFSNTAEKRNSLIKQELNELRKEMNISFITPSNYDNLD